MEETTVQHGVEPFVEVGAGQRIPDEEARGNALVECLALGDLDAPWRRVGITGLYWLCEDGSLDTDSPIPEG